MSECTCKTKQHTRLAESDQLIVTRCECGTFWLEPKVPQAGEAYRAVGDEVELCRIVSALSAAIGVRRSLYA